MQNWPLTADRFLDHAKAWHGDQEVVTRSVEGPITRTTYAEIHARAKRVSNALRGLGVKPGDRIATLGWNTARHIELWYGIMGMGAICHTLNPRLFAEQLVYIINHAGDRIIFADISLLPVLAAIRSQIPVVEHVVAMTDKAHLPAGERALAYESLVERASAEFTWGGFDENTAAGLCYTSGTTGNPKGVLYSHRSNFLHTLAMLSPDVLGLSAVDVVLAVVPMFHANGWGLAFACPAAGTKLVLPGQKLDGASIHELLETEGVTFTAGVPTVWQMLLAHLRESRGKLTTLRRIAVGGSAVPEALARGFRDEFGVNVLHAWGMTEISPIGTVAAPTGATLKMDTEQQYGAALSQGRPPVMVDLTLVNDDGARLPHDGKACGRLLIKGPFVVDRYFGDDSAHKLLDSEGFFDTGDVATIDSLGFMRITDRSKDIIKSGGEWISSIEIENLVVAHPKAALAAVIGVAHDKWAERPILIVKLKPGETGTKQEFLAFLEGKIAKWWTPDDVIFVNDVPLGPTGKIDKKLIRKQFADYRLP